MQKIKRDLYDRLILEKLSKLELAFIFLLAKNCDENGNVEGIYYAETSKKLNCSEAMFYLLRDSLEKKKFISWTKNNSADIDVKLLGNEFTVDENNEIEYKEYIDINIEIFNEPKFFECKAKAIQLMLYIVKCVASKGAITLANTKSANPRIAQSKRTIWTDDIDKKYKELASLLGVTRRAIKEYIIDLAKWMEVKKSNDNVTNDKHKDKDIIVVLKDALIKPKYQANKNSKKNEKNIYPERYRYLHFISTIVRRNKIISDKNNISDIADLIFQYIKISKDKNKDIFTIIKRIVCNNEMVELNTFKVQAYLKNVLSF